MSKTSFKVRNKVYRCALGAWNLPTVVVSRGRNGNGIQEPFSWAHGYAGNVGIWIMCSLV